MNSPAPSAQASSSGGKSACLITGCVIAALFGIALVIVGISVAIYYLGVRETSKSGGHTNTLTISYDPARQPSLVIGGGGSIADSDWPAAVDPFVFESVSASPDPAFGESLAGAIYRDEANGRTVAVHLLEASTSEQYSALANSLYAKVAVGSEIKNSLSNNYSSFTSDAFPTSRFLLRPLNGHVAYFRVDYGSAEAAAADAPEETVAEALLDAITRPAPSVIGFPSHDESKGDLPYPKGPSLADDGSVAWYEPSPEDDHFALVRVDVPLPEPLAGLAGHAAGYHALEFEKDVSLPFTLAFIPHPDGADPETTFQEVLKALSSDGEQIVYDGFSSFSTLQKDVETSAVFVNKIEIEEAFCSVTVFTNGVTVAFFDLPRKPEETDAFPSLPSLSFGFHEKLVVAWADAE